MPEQTGCACNCRESNNHTASPFGAQPRHTDLSRGTSAPFFCPGRFEVCLCMNLMISRSAIRPVPRWVVSRSEQAEPEPPLFSGNKFSVESGQKQSSMLQEALKT
jgi:hypothetical protein